MRSFWLPVVALICANAQTPAPPELTIRTTTTLVQVGVSVRDANGRPISGLKKEDFEVLDRGNPQKISVFYSESDVAPKTQDPVAPAEEAPVLRAAPLTTARSFSNRIAEAAPTRATYAIILLDWTNTAFENEASAREEAKSALDKIAPSDRVGLYSFDRNGLKIIDEVGSGRAAVAQHLKTVTGQPAPCYQPPLTMHDDKDWRKGGGSMLTCSGNNRAMLLDYVERRSRATLRIFEAIAAHLASLPGRKSLIWISAGFPRTISFSENTLAHGYTRLDDQFDRAVRTMNNADVSLYAIDSRGVTFHDPRKKPDNDTWSTMDDLAERTGGKAFYGRNDYGAELAEAAEDVQTSYTLGFYASYDSAQSGLHRLTVRVSRGGTTLRYKEGYFVAPELTTKEAREEATSYALTAMIDATGIPIDLQATRHKDAVNLRISLKPETLGLERRGGRWLGAVEVVTRFARADGSEAAEPALARFELDLSQPTYEKAQQQGLTLSRELKMPASAATVRLLARSVASGAMGTLTVPTNAIAAQ